LESQPSSRTGENPPYEMIGGIEEPSASFEARSTPRSYPTTADITTDLVAGGLRQLLASTVAECWRRQRSQARLQLPCRGAATGCPPRAIDRSSNQILRTDLIQVARMFFRAPPDETGTVGRTILDLGPKPSSPTQCTWSALEVGRFIVNRRILCILASFRSVLLN
jgi:hypothetical protein